MGFQFDELPGWLFEIDEVSACVYKVRGSDCEGRSVEVAGTDPIALLSQCRRKVREILRQERDKKN